MGFGKFAEKSQITENQALIYLRMHWALPEQRRYNVGRPSIAKMNSNSPNFYFPYFPKSQCHVNC